MQVMPDGSQTVILESSDWMSLRWASRMPNRVVPQKYSSFCPSEDWDRSFSFCPGKNQESGNYSPEVNGGFILWKIQRRHYLAACRQQET